MDQEGASDEQAFFIGDLGDKKSTENEWHITLKVKESTSFKIYTGSQSNVCHPRKPL